MANAADFGVLQLLSDEDLAPMIAVWLRPVAASHLRAVCSVANAALTSTQWAASQWKEWRLGLLSSWQREKLVFYAMIDVGETGTPQRTILRFEGKFLHIENFFGDFYSLAIDVDSSTLSVSGTSKQDTSLEIAGHWVDAGFKDCSDLLAFRESWDSAYAVSIGGYCEFKRFKAFTGQSYMKVHRADELTAALKARGLALRQDSWLCNGYIDGKPQVGSLRDVVEGMAEMHFYFSKTRYAACRQRIAQEHFEDARDMYLDAMAWKDPDAGDDPSDYQVPLDAAQLSAAAKERSLRWLLAAVSSVPGPGREFIVANKISESTWREMIPATAPDAVHQLLREIVSRLSDRSVLVNSRLEELRYKDNRSGGRSDDENPRARPMRAEMRSIVREQLKREKMELQPHVAALHSLREGPIGGERRFPASLSTRQRGLLHDLAEELGLAHDSDDQGDERHLVAWRVDEEALSSSGEAESDEESDMVMESDDVDDGPELG